MEELKNQKKVYLGMLMVGIGFFYILRNLGIIPYEVSEVLFSWPVFMIVLGVFFYIANKNIVVSLTAITLGVFFLIPQCFHVPLNFRHIFWPVILVIAGVAMIFRKPVEMKWKKDKHKIFYGGETNADMIDEVAIFGGCEKYITSDSFKGGKITSIFGGSSLDFSNSVLADGVSEIELANIFGGTKLIIPSDWNIKMEVVSVFGGFVDKRRNISPVNVNPNKILIIKGACVFGGGEIRN